MNIVKQKSQELKARWTMELKVIEAQQLKTQFEIECAKILQEEIDWEILSDMMVECGWTKVEISLDRMHIVEKWIEENIQGKYKFRGTDWLFESEKDATMFILRWS